MRSVERRRTSAGPCSPRAHRPRSRAALERRRAPCARRRPRTARGRRPGRSLPSVGATAPLGRERGEVDLRQRLLDQALLVVLGERLPRDLLGRDDREVGDFLADLVERAAGLRLDLAAGPLHRLLVLLAGLLARVVL